MASKNIFLHVCACACVFVCVVWRIEFCCDWGAKNWVLPKQNSILRSQNSIFGRNGEFCWSKTRHSYHANYTSFASQIVVRHTLVLICEPAKTFLRIKIRKKFVARLVDNMQYVFAWCVCVVFAVYVCVCVCVCVRVCRWMAFVAEQKCESPRLA